MISTFLDFHSLCGIPLGISESIFFCLNTSLQKKLKINHGVKLGVVHKIGLK